MGISWEDRPGIQREHGYIYIYILCVCRSKSIYVYNPEYDTLNGDSIRAFWAPKTDPSHVVDFTDPTDKVW